MKAIASMKRGGSTVSATSDSSKSGMQRVVSMKSLPGHVARSTLRSGSILSDGTVDSHAAAVGHWMTEDMLTAPKHHCMAHIKHVLCKRSFFLALVFAGASTAIAVTREAGVTPVTTELPHDKLYTVFSTLVSFFVVIRTGHALSRLFQAADIVYSIHGLFADVVCSLLSFTRKATADDESVHSFRNMLVILMSMLNAVCLAELEDSASMSGEKSRAYDYNLINFVGFPTDALAEISASNRKAETVFQMIQALIVDNTDNGILNIPAPILTRSFQEMSQAMLKVHEAHKLIHVPYPVDLNAASAFFLVVHSVITIWYLPNWIPEFQLALLAIFIVVFSYWFVHFICGELENPFSSSCTAIDLALVQDELNLRLQAFVHGASRRTLPLRAEAAHQSNTDRSLRGLRTYVSSEQDCSPRTEDASLRPEAQSQGSPRPGEEVAGRMVQTRQAREQVDVQLGKSCLKSPTTAVADGLARASQERRVQVTQLDGGALQQGGGAAWQSHQHLAVVAHDAAAATRESTDPGPPCQERIDSGMLRGDRAVVSYAGDAPTVDDLESANFSVLRSHEV